MGIYGSRAVGKQTLDELGRTTEFELNFDFEAVVQAEEKWDRLQVYATNYAQLLDRAHSDR